MQLHGPFCGDGVVQAHAIEECDDGFNLSPYMSRLRPGLQESSPPVAMASSTASSARPCDDGNTGSKDGQRLAQLEDPGQLEERFPAPA